MKRGKSLRDESVEGRGRRICDATGNQPESLVAGFSGNPTALSWSPVGRYFVVHDGSAATMIDAQDVNSRRVVHATIPEEQSVVVWDTDNCHPVFRQSLADSFHGEVLGSLELNRDGSRLFTGEMAMGVGSALPSSRIWDVQQGLELLQVADGYGLGFAGDANWAMTISGWGRTRAPVTWRVRDGRATTEREPPEDGAAGGPVAWPQRYGPCFIGENTRDEAQGTARGWMGIEPTL